MVKDFWRDRRVLLTGHTGFKGAWAALWLEALGADVTGLALAPEPGKSLFNMLSPWKQLKSHLCDIRDATTTRLNVLESEPEIVIHMAAQSLVRRSYRKPLETLATNIMGTSNLLQALLELPVKPQAIIIVTSDKVYQNNDSGRAFNEDDRLGGDDPYSASKACTEMVTHAFRESYFKANSSQLASARAGNVIGGGDWSEDRLIPDLIRSIEHKTPFVLRNPNATRPWQHVLDVISGYFTYIEALIIDQETPLALNFGPTRANNLSTAEIVRKLGEAIGTSIINKISSQTLECKEKEKQLLSIDATRATETLGWKPRLSIQESLQWTAAWYRSYLEGKDMRAFSLAQLNQFESLTL